MFDVIVVGGRCAGAPLAMLLARPDVDLVGVTTVADDAARRAGYARYVLRMAGRASIPVAAGAESLVAQHLFGPYGDSVLRSLTIVALLSAVNSNVLMAPRVLFAMSRDGLFWRGAREVNRGGTPDIALLFSSLMAVAFIVSGRFEQVIAVLAFFFVANYTLSFASLFVRRRRDPHAPRPYRAIGHPFTTGLALFASVAFLLGAIISDTRNSVYALGVLAISFPVYRLMKR